MYRTTGNDAIRVLWAVNHKTLMESEIEILRQLGCEVFVPKILPKKGFRSGAVTFEHDCNLSIPAEDISKLNNHNFYEHEWSLEITEIINRYFQVIFVIHWPTLISEAVTKFFGKILFRVYGLQNNFSYSQFLLDHGGEWVREIFEFRQSDVVLAIGYPQIVENEPDWLAQNSVYLPITAPTSFWQYKHSYLGNTDKIMFLCSNRLTSEYYANQFRLFKSVIEPNQYIVVDSEDHAEGDSSVRFRPSQNELIELYRTSALFYTPARELRTTLYSPIEANIIGCPIIYHRDSLLGRLTPDVTFGKVNSYSEAKDLVSKIVSGNQGLKQDIIDDQKNISENFKVSNCLQTWRRNFLFEIVQKESTTTDFKSITSFNENYHLGKFNEADFVNHQITQNKEELEEANRILEICLKDYNPTPWFVKKVKGLSWPEEFGRWTYESKVEIELTLDLSKDFFLKVVASSHEENLGKKVTVYAGSRRSSFRIKSPTLTEYTIKCKAAPGFKKLILSVPNLYKPLNDSRSLGLAIRSITIY